MNRKSIAVVLAAFLWAIQGMTAFAANRIEVPEPDENTLIKEYEFTTTEKPFVYNLAQKSIREKNREYFLQGDIEYTLLSEQDVFSEEAKEFNKTESRSGLSSQNESVFPDSVVIEEDGYEGDIPVKNVSFQAQTIDGGSKTLRKTISYGYQIEAPTAPETVDLPYKGETLPLPFKEMLKTKTYWQENHVARVTLYSDRETYTFESGRTLDLMADAPAWQGLEFDFFSLMKLDAGAHVIQSARWEGGLNEQGDEISATIVFTMKRLVSYYTAVYQMEYQNPDMTAYDGTAQYSGILTKKIKSGTEYTVKAKITYYADPLPTPTPSPTPKPTLTPVPELLPEPDKKSGAGGIVVVVILLAVLGGGGYFALKWKQKRDSEM